MSSFEVALPISVSNAILKKGKSLASRWEGNEYGTGYDDGYRAGKWQAQMELSRDREQLSKESEKLISLLKQINTEVQSMTEQHLPELILSTLSRIFAHHHFTEEEVASEVEGIVKEISNAQHIALECSENDLNALHEKFETLGLSLENTELVCSVNASLSSGEFVLRSDLGYVDGRHIARIAQVQDALIST